MRFTGVLGGECVSRKNVRLGLYRKEATEPKCYGEIPADRIMGVYEKATGRVEISRVHSWVLKKNGGTAAAWTCVNNCNRSKIEQQANLLMLPIGSPLKSSQIDLLMRHGRLRLNDYRWICCENDEVFIKEEKIPLAQAFGWGESLGDFRVN